MQMIARGAASLSLALAVASAGAAPVTYDFTFTDLDTADQVDGTGSFVTGDAAADLGYFLLTSLTYTSVRVSGVLQTGSAVQTVFDPGAAYDPATGAFVSHYNGATDGNYGGGYADGTIGSFVSVYTDGTDFSTGQTSSGLFSGFAITPSERLTRFIDPTARTIVEAPVAPDPGTVPEPGSIALIGIGLIGLFMHRRTTSTCAVVADDRRFAPAFGSGRTREKHPAAFAHRSPTTGATCPFPGRNAWGRHTGT